MTRQPKNLHSIQSIEQWPDWTPPALVTWLNSVKARALPFDPRIVTDPRMAEVWRWFQQAKFAQVSGLPPGALESARSSVGFCIAIARATVMPGKPGSLPPKERTAYLEKVRKHANALNELLDGTRFSVPEFGTEVDLDNLDKEVRRDLAPWGDEDPGHIVAYSVDSDGVWRMPWDYPDNYLGELLNEVIAWTYQDDYFDRAGMRSSAPIGHARSRSTPTIYFTCTLHGWYSRDGLEIPFQILATVANVALGLADDEMLDEDAARKQVRRYQKKSSARKVSKAAEEQENDGIAF